MLQGRKPILFVVLTFGLAGHFPQNSNAATSNQEASQPSSRKRTDKPRKTKSLIYKNKKYRFSFALPDTWKGYSIIVSQWGGAIVEEGQSTPTREESGPLITIRHPLWKEFDWQDIPIMVFTRAQWKYVEENGMIVSAAPVGPNEIGRNARYVFALPPRFNYADVSGREEVEEILQHHPLHPR